MATTSIQLTDLDDACIQAVFSFLHPLPDLFNVAASCRRLRDLALDRKSWLVVSLTASEPVIGVPRQYRQLFKSLQDAIVASRPGDTIFLQPGVYSVADTIVPWPIHILGGGVTPEETLLVSGRGADTAMDFRASGRLFNLSIRSQLGSCITHRCGKLSVEQVFLECETEGLDHLVSPIATLAVSPAPCVGISKHQTTADKLFSMRGKDQERTGGSVAAGPGMLSVVESKIKGGRTAIQLLGSGELGSVRAIYRSQYTLLWFTVDSAVPGLHPASSRWGVRRKRGAAELVQTPLGESTVDSQVANCSAVYAQHRAQEEQGTSVPQHGQASSATPALSPITPVLPAWMRRPPFNPMAFQQRVHAEMTQQQEGAQEQQQQGEQLGQMQKKARQWSWHHAAALQSRQ